MASGASHDLEKEAAEDVIKSSNDEKDKEYDKILENWIKPNLPDGKEKYGEAHQELVKKGCEKIYENALVTGDFEVHAAKGGKVKDATFNDFVNDPVKMSAMINHCETMSKSDPYNINNACQKVLATTDFGTGTLKWGNDPKNIAEVSYQLLPRVMAEVDKQNKEIVLEEFERICKQAYLDKMGGKVETITDDGDQTPMSGHKGHILDQLMAYGLDWQPATIFSSTWMDILAFGNFDGMLNYIKHKTNEEIRQLLEKRETKLNYSALHHVIRGMVFNSDHVESKSKHMECFCKLIDLGANIHARDMCGLTPLLACSSFECSLLQFLKSNQTLLKMMKILLKHGADPNAKDRRGNTALRSPAKGLNFEFVKLLLEAGADPTIPNNDGEIVECCQQAQHSTMKRLFAEARKMRTKQMRVKAKEEAGGVLKKCNVCGDSSENSRCTGCFMAHYCSKECQNLDWKNHRKLCRQIREQYVPVNLTVKDDLAISKRRTGQVKLVEKLQKPVKDHFVVKIQIPIDQRSWGPKLEKKGLMLSDKMMTVLGEITDDEPVYTALVAKIQAEGVFGQKGFFYAVLDEEKNMKINANKILPPELW